MASDESEVLVLDVFPPAIDREVGRWIVARHGIAFRERLHTPEAYALTMIRYGRGATPITSVRGERVGGPRALAEALEPHADAERRLMHGLSSSQIDEAWNGYNAELGLAVAAIVYGVVLPQPSIAEPLLRNGTPPTEQTIHALLGPLPRWTFAGMLWLARLGARPAAEIIDAWATKVEERLKAGGPYLGGARFSLLDLLFCASVAPLVIPSQHPGPLPQPQTTPGLAEALAPWMDRPMSAYVRRIYATER